MSIDPDSVKQPKRKLATKTMRGLTWSFSSTGVKAIVRIGTLAVLARLVTPAEFGLVTAAWLVMDLIERFYQVGVGQALVQRAELTPRHVRTGFTLSVASGFVFAAVLFALSPLCAAFFRMPLLESILRATSVLLILNAAGTVSTALLQRDLAFGRLAVIDIISKILGYGAVGIGMALAGYGVWALVGAAFGYRVLMTIQLMLASRHSLRPLLDRRAAADLLGFGGGMTLSGLLNFAAQEGDNFIVGRWLGDVALGIYGRAYNMLRMPLALFGKVLNQVMFASMSQVQHDRRAMGMAYKRGSYAIALVVLPLGAFVYLLAPELVDVVLGQEWTRTVAILQIFSVGMLFRTAYPFSGIVARSAGAVYRVAMRQGIYGVLVLCGAWFGKPWGLEGIAIGVTVAISVQYLMMLQLSMSIVELRWIELAKAHVPALVLTGLVSLETLGVAYLTRELAAPSIVTLVGAVVLVGLTLLALLLSASPRILGPDGLWIARIALKTFGRKLPLGSRLKRRVLEHAVQ